MPNTLAHITGGIPLALFWAQARDLKWLYLGCVIPDFPWILQRIVTSVITSVDLFAVRNYFIAQSSLFICLLICFSLALLSNRPARIFLLLGVSSFVHLLLDASQIKWANGVILAAPVNWMLVSDGHYWPESAFNYGLTSIGLLVFIIMFPRAIRRSCNSPIPGNTRMVWSGILFSLWLLTPFLAMAEVQRLDAHFLETLKHRSDRPGKYVEIDRIPVLVSAQAVTLHTNFSDVIYLTFNKNVSGAGLNDPRTESIAHPGTYSIKGFFTGPDTVEVTDYHRHSGFRDASTMVGLSLVALVWATWSFGWLRERLHSRP